LDKENLEPPLFSTNFIFEFFKVRKECRWRRENWGKKKERFERKMNCGSGDALAKF
jgi:hypothetical protein